MRDLVGSDPGLETRKAQPLFIIGTARSGTTWLANLLESHPRVAAVTASVHHGIHESHLLDHTRYCFPKRLTFGEFLQRYQEEDYFKLTGLELDSLLRGPRVEGDVVDFFNRLMEAFANARAADYWLEKTPKHTLYYRELITRFPTARFVVIERQFGDTLLSQLNMYARPNAPRWLQILEKTVRYELDMRAIARLRRQAAKRVITIRYEDLRSNPTSVLRNVTALLGLDDALLESRFPPNSSFTADRPPAFSAERLPWLLISAARWLVRLAPFSALSYLRRRRDRAQARTFPKYSKVT